MGEASFLELAFKYGGPALGIYALGIFTHRFLSKREYDRLIAENDRLQKKHDEFFDAYRNAAIEAERSRRE